MEAAHEAVDDPSRDDLDSAERGERRRVEEVSTSWGSTFHRTGEARAVQREGQSNGSGERKTESTVAGRRFTVGPASMSIDRNPYPDDRSSVFGSPCRLY